jgi:hypothetical protein
MNKEADTMSDTEMARTGPEMTVAEQAMLDVQKGLQAMARRAQQLVKSDPTVEEITDYDRRRFGMAVRFEVDVCIPLPDLKRELNLIRAELTNCIAILERSGSGNERRKMVHSRLRDIRGELKYQRQERNEQDSRLPK